MSLNIAIVGAGAIGGYLGVKLALSGCNVTFIARGAHLDAIRHKGLEIQSAKLGDFTVKATAESDTSRVGPVDVVIVSDYGYGILTPGVIAALAELQRAAPRVLFVDSKHLPDYRQVGITAVKPNFDEAAALLAGRSGLQCPEEDHHCANAKNQKQGDQI